MSGREEPPGPFACWRVRRKLQSYLDGMLEGAAARRIARHLGACARCRHEVEVYQAIKNSLARSLGRRQRGPDAVQRLRGFGETLRRDPEE